MNIKSVIVFIFLTLCLTPPLHARIIIASGAGYRALVDELTRVYTSETGKKVELIYGNMAQVSAQAKNSGTVDLVLGDKSFLDKTDLEFSTIKTVGRGRLVLAYAKGKTFSGPDHLLSPAVSRIALPDTQRAIYGKAALEYLHNKKIFNQVASKLLMVATVPQSASYVIAREVDFAFINQTHARKILKSIGGYVPVDESAYGPILIIIGQLAHSANGDASAGFIRFLNSENARSIVSAHGMQIN